LVIVNLTVVDEVRLRVLATRLKGFSEYFPSLLVAPLDEGPM